MQYEFYLSATDLPKGDLFSESDPFCEVFFQNATTGPLMVMGKTEVIDNNKSPNWTKQFKFEYHFHENQRIVIRVYDQDSGGVNDYLGEVVCLVPMLIQSPNCTVTIPLQGAKRVGSVTIKGEAISQTDGFLLTQISCTKLSNKDGFFGKSDPFYVLSRLREDRSWVEVFRSEPVMNNLSPKFPPLKLSLQQLCNGDFDRPLKVEIFDWESNGKFTSMGGFQTSLNKILNDAGHEINIIEEDKKAKNKKYVNSGTLVFNDTQIEQHPAFQMFIQGGCEISLLVAIDFTGSNGSYEHPHSLHYLDPSGVTKNQYQRVIESVGSILEQYDKDHLFPVYGFGAQIKQPNGTLSPTRSMFQVNETSLEVQGIDGIMNAYLQVLPKLKFSGPTLFAPLLDSVIHRLSQPENVCSQQQQKYFILLIMTDGIIEDLQDTIDCIVRASRLPLSIVIVGVGNADFSGMKTLDGDDGKLRASNGEIAERDIVQFVPYAPYALEPLEKLSTEVLKEIPGQFTDYMRKYKIRPNITS